MDRVALVNGVVEGPVVAAGSWQQSVPFDVDSARVYRDGAASSAKSIQNNDIVYWSESMQTLWVYTDGWRHDPGTEPHPLQPHFREGGRPDL